MLIFRSIAPDRPDPPNDKPQLSHATLSTEPPNIACRCKGNNLKTDRKKNIFKRHVMGAFVRAMVLQQKKKWLVLNPHLVAHLLVIE